jgi:hypothetical protein|tara:strand:+ start:273 stop:554 length:282 start_codon:yes stop_codon:yes gene_type:complete
MSKFEISENPTIENTAALEANVKPIVKQEVSSIKGNTKVLKIKINGQPFYHFSSVEFDSELATKNSNMVVGGKRFYKGLTDKRMITRLKLSSI